MSFLSADPLDPSALLNGLRRGKDGGLALFVGVVRSENEGHSVDRLVYEAYGPMAEKEMARISQELEKAHPAAQVLFRHRVGALVVGDVAVVVAASAPHRAEAFAACRAGIEAIKARVPIWKHEFGPSGAVWIEPCGEVGHEHESD